MPATTELDDASSDARRLAALAWPLRAADELRSAMIFRAARNAARRLELHAMVAALDLVVRDELRHTRLCTHLARGCSAPAPRHDLTPVRERLASLSPSRPRFRLAALLLVEAAIGETISMALFRAGRRSTVEPRAREALTSIVIDEVRHARLGWKYSGELWPTLDAQDRASLAVQASLGLAAMEHQVAVPALRRLEANEPFDPVLAALGVLSPAARVDAFYEIVDRVVLPRLDRLGLDGRAAWDNRYLARSV